MAHPGMRGNDVDCARNRFWRPASTEGQARARNAGGETGNLRSRPMSGRRSPNKSGPDDVG